jgi:hypothetical protein
MDMSGVLYYNTGTSCTVRLLVSIYTLRKYYKGEIAILSEGQPSNEICQKISNALDAYIVPINPKDIPTKNHHFLVKTKMHQYTPFEQNVYIDADTLIKGPIDELLNQDTFFVTPISNWKPNQQPISGRILQWQTILPDMIQPALLYKQAINTGIFGFNINDQIMQDWYNYAIKGIDLFIPDEVSLQIMLPKYQHKVLDTRFNCSCVQDNPDNPDIRIVHYHGRKHCKIEYHGILWINAYTEVIKLDIADIKSWQPAGDKTLSNFLHYPIHEQYMKSQDIYQPS